MTIIIIIYTQLTYVWRCIHTLCVQFCCCTFLIIKTKLNHLTLPTSSILSTLIILVYVLVILLPHHSFVDQLWQYFFFFTDNYLIIYLVFSFLVVVFFLYMVKILFIHCTFLILFLVIVDRILSGYKKK